MTMPMEDYRSLCIAFATAAALTLGAALLWRQYSKRPGPPKRQPLKGPVALDPSRKIPFELVKKERVSHDTRKFTFALQSEDHVLGLPIGNHMYLSASIDGETVVRPYTPVTSNDEKGYFDLVIKVYFANVHPKFPEGGKMSQYLESLSTGDCVDVRGPAGKVEYLGMGYLRVKEPGTAEGLRCASNIGLIAGGTGITPMLQIIREVMKNKEDTTRISLLFANQSEQDILLREELEQLANENDSFSLWYTVDRPTEGWKYSSGFVNAEMIEGHLPSPGPATQILMCGPKPMIKFACLPNLQKLGYSQEMYVAF